MATHAKVRAYTLPVGLRPEARTAAIMLLAIQRKGERSRYNRSLNVWIGELVDAFTCTRFEEMFGISVTEFLQRVRARVPKRKRWKYVPSEQSLQRSAERLLARQDKLTKLAAF